ncbi:hypothetical protein Micbo1qcDRAFT_174666 [Microdochium bolleyi]|uniref:RmlC-like cupin domain-containing protein n=1 Tax=Microdochium bolleyi TaxID=196109 RepID=A0A136J308_9PEZI|nr:hypothetical protein Micbo1qcDRAFT_174666 [Microdochium bolleyi]
MSQWQARAAEHFQNESDTQRIIDLALAVSFLEMKKTVTDASQHFSSEHGELAWQLIRGALGSTLCRGPVFKQPQGYFAIHLCSLLIDCSKTDVLYRLHVWLPGQSLAPAGFTVHSHQGFAQSWVLAGQATDTHFDVEDAAADLQAATHAKYGVVQNFQRLETDPEGRKHRVSSTLQSTGQLVKATEADRMTYLTGTTYTMPPGTIHCTDYVPGELYAAIFVFDSNRGWVQDSHVLGPREGNGHTNERYQNEVRPRQLVDAVDAAMTRPAPRDTCRG